MNHFGEIRSLVSFVRPHVALITTIAPAHLEFFGSCEAIADAKSEIFEGIIPGGAAVIPADSPYAERLRARARQANVGRVLSFGKDAGTDAQLTSVQDSADGMRIEAQVLGRDVHFRLQASGAHLAANALGALLAVAAGARSRVDFRGGTIELIDESYNANPASVAAALDVLSRTEPASGGKRVAVLGDMLELGADAASLHAALARDLEAARVDLVFLAGPLMQALWNVLPPSRQGGYAETAVALAPQVLNALRPGDVVLVKASNGIRMSQILEALKASEKRGAA
jgi:UDP-N-acetylmuramoyl-tripeptide--D-alanyl-D-alanine ligase